jgi:hypothetical protein
MRQAAHAFVKAVVDDLLQNPKTAALFPDAKADLSLHERGPMSRGWICGWGYEHNVKWVNAPPQMQVATLPSFDPGTPGMVFHLFVALDHGGDMVWRVENYPILPNLIVSYYLESGGEPADLPKQIEAVMKTHLPQFRKAVGVDPASGTGPTLRPDSLPLTQ